MTDRSSPAGHEQADLRASAEQFITAANGARPCDAYEPDRHEDVLKGEDPLCEDCHFPKADHIIKALLAVLPPVEPPQHAPTCALNHDGIAYRGCTCKPAAPVSQEPPQKETNREVELSSILEAATLATMGREVSDFMLSFPLVRDVADLYQELQEARKSASALSPAGYREQVRPYLQHLQTCPERISTFFFDPQVSGLCNHCERPYSSHTNGRCHRCTCGLTSLIDGDR